MLFEVNHSRDFKTSCDHRHLRCRFCNIKETDNNHSRWHWQSFQFRFNSSAEIVCNQLNFNRKIFVFSRIFSLHDNLANPNIN